MSLPGRSRSRDLPIFNASANCRVNPSIDFLVVDIIVNWGFKVKNIIVSDKIQKGNEGENLAAEFLKKKGWEIVARNYRYRHAEIDLIIKRDDWTIFVEVKTRSHPTYGQPGRICR